MAGVKLSEIRAKFPMYADVPDDQLLSAVHRKYYADMPIGEFASHIDYDTQRKAMQKDTLDEMGSGGEFVAGAGHALQSLINTGKRLNPFSDYTGADAAAEEEIAKPLMDTGAGRAGDIAAQIALAAVPGGAAGKVASGIEKLAPGAAEVLSAGTPTIESLVGRVLPKALMREASAAELAGGSGAQVPGLLADLGQAAASGAAQGAAFSPGDFSEGATAGAIGGGAGKALGKLVGKVAGGPLGDEVTPEARALMEQGIDVPLWKATPNQFIRGTAETSKALPVAKDIVRGQEATAMHQWNEGLVRAATAPKPVLDDAGNVLRWVDEPIEGAGQKALQEAHARANEAYGALYKGRSIPVDDTFRSELQQVLDETRNYFPSVADDVAGAAKRLADTMMQGTGATTQTQVVKQAGTLGSGKVSSRIATPAQTTTTTTLGHEAIQPNAVQQSLSQLDDQITAAWRAGDADKAGQLSAMRDAVEGLRTRGLPPEVQSMKAPIDEAYANFKTLSRAAAMMGAQKTEGIVTPQQLLNAIRAGDKTGGKQAFAEGTARGQQAALQAQKVLGDTLPEVGPGTGEKLAPLLMLSGLAGGGLGFAPAGYAGLVAALATKPGQKYLAGALPGQQLARQYSPQIAELLRRLGATRGDAPQQNP